MVHTIDATSSLMPDAICADRHETAHHEHNSRPGSVLVGVDGSRGAALALAWAHHHCGQDVPLVAVSCWSTPWWGVSQSGKAKLSASRRSEAAARNSARRSVRQLGLLPDDESQPVVCTRQGPAGEVLIDLSPGAPMLVVGRTKRGRLARSVLGSTSAHCARNSASPVAIVPSGVDPRAPLAHVAVGVDGSGDGIEALRWTLRFAPPESIIDVYFSHLSFPVVESLSPVELDRVSIACRGFLDAVVDRVIAEEAMWDRPIHRHLLAGDATAVLSPRTISMFVVGADSKTGLASVRLGSRENDLIGSATTVTVVVPSTSNNTNTNTGGL